jgi:DASS family divalent anion:Na+ symporter
VALLVPQPPGVAPDGIPLLGFFVATVAGLVLEPLPAGAWALICVAPAVASGALTFEAAFAAADSQVLWLIVLAFLLAKVRAAGGALPAGLSLFARAARACA